MENPYCSCKLTLTENHSSLQLHPLWRIPTAAASYRLQAIGCRADSCSVPQVAAALITLPGVRRPAGAGAAVLLPPPASPFSRRFSRASEGASAEWQHRGVCPQVGPKVASCIALFSLDKVRRCLSPPFHRPFTALSLPFRCSRWTRRTRSRLTRTSGRLRSGECCCPCSTCGLSPNMLAPITSSGVLNQGLLSLRRKAV